MDLPVSIVYKEITPRLSKSDGLLPCCRPFTNNNVQSPSTMPS